MGGEDGCDGSWGIYFLYRRQMICNTKDQQPWNNTKQIFPEQKTKKSFVLHHLCQVHEVLSGIWNLLIPGQIVSLGIYKNYASSNHVSTSSCMLRIEKLITFNITCIWTFHTNSLLHDRVFVSHECTQITINTFIFYRDNSVLMRVLCI